MSRRPSLLNALAGAVLLCSGCGPDPDRIVGEGIVCEENGFIRYGGKEYRSAFTQYTTREGRLRLRERHHDRLFPFVTHDIALATGDFSDPEKVAITSQGGGNFFWRARTRPRGTLIFFHVIPENRIVLNSLEEADEGDALILMGKIDIGNTITDTDGNQIALGHENHKFIFVTTLGVRPDHDR